MRELLREQGVDVVPVGQLVEEGRGVVRPLVLIVEIVLYKWKDSVGSICFGQHTYIFIIPAT